jgi:hypothetical protein
MGRMCVCEPRQLLRGVLDSPVMEPEHVDRRRGEMHRTDPLGDDEHPLTFVRQPETGRQSGETGADHDRVVRHAGRCWTPSSPWKIQSSSRACRN